MGTLGMRTIALFITIISIVIIIAVVGNSKKQKNNLGNTI